MDLSTLSDEAFRKVVDDDLRGRASANVSEALRSPDNVNRWHASLLTMTKSVEGQLAARKSDWQSIRTRLRTSAREFRDQDPDKADRFLKEFQEEQEKYLKWRGGIIRFKTGLEEYLADARHRLDRDMYERFASDERAALARRCRMLEEGIKRHRDIVTSDEELDHDEADEELWSLIS